MYANAGLGGQIRRIESGEGGGLSAASLGRVPFLWRPFRRERHRAGGQPRRFEVASSLLRWAGAVRVYRSALQYPLRFRAL